MRSGDTGASWTRLAADVAAAPWRVTNELLRVASLPRARLVFRLNGIRWGRRWRIFGAPIIQRYRGSTIEIGDGLSLRSIQTTNPLSPNHPVVLSTRTPGATIRIGEDCSFTGTSIVAMGRIEIGDRVTVGANCAIVDTDFHPLDPTDRGLDPCAGDHAPVEIGSDVFIGMSCIILKGVTIGAGSVVAAGSVVVKDVPPEVVVGGNPATVLHPLGRKRSSETGPT